ncbi:MAG: hypothetical protein F4045_07610 [Chloroflexi bacterium]|nr:hypothetical protein [Chloroflexota bacterium]MYK34962.1 hypothetical protein [Chloroflexota bacterium]
MTATARGALTPHRAPSRQPRRRSRSPAPRAPRPRTPDLPCAAPARLPRRGRRWSSSCSSRV